MSVLQMPQRTFTAKLFEAGAFKVAGTLDGFIDLATPNGTYPLSLEEVTALSEALKRAAADVEANCIYDRDSLLAKEIS